ncbi:MAG: hypothetical protein AABY22_09370, partial [Nanoarchaeota archaeon]
MNISKRDFLKISSSTCLIPSVVLDLEQFPKKYHRITRDWSFSTSSCTHWNDFNIYSKIGLSKINRDICSDEIDNESEYVLISQDAPYIYVNKDKSYEISNFKGDFVKNTNQHLYEASFDIVKYLGPTPKERIIIISGWGYCIYALWSLDKREVYGPLTEEMHSKLKYFSDRKTYQQYLCEYNTKLKELNL